MASEKRLIDTTPEHIRAVLEKVPYYPDEIWKFTAMTERFPTVDAVEVVHGRYIQKPHDEWWAPYYVCLECGTQMMVADEEGRNIKPNLCPHCGAKMDGERRTDVSATD